MNDIHISKTISDKRREKGVTQDQLAAYMGVSKASVSKWETGQSYPDITFLPQLAAYFNISIDDLMGYSPQMTKEGIKDLYLRLSADFSRKPINDVLAECREIIKKYFSCFPLLMQMAVLLCNHHMLAAEAGLQKGILEEAVDLCIRIKNESGDVWLAKEAVSIEATCYLMLGEPQNVLELLGETIRPISNDGTGIAQAYLMLGNSMQADKVFQISIYQHLLSFVGAAVSLLQLCNDRFEETLHRILSVAAVFDLEQLHPNLMALTYLTAGQGYCIRGETEKALDMLQKYTDLCLGDFTAFSLHGDSFFNGLDSWFMEFDLGTATPRNEKVIKEGMLQSIEQNPTFASIKDHPRYRSIITMLKLNSGGN